MTYGLKYTECLHMSLPLPVAFCYVPSQQQIQQFFNKKSKTKKESSTVVVTSPVDRKISFFGPQSTLGDCSSSSDQTGSESHWSHLQQDKLWQTVLEYCYNLCNVSNERRAQAMNLYIKRRVKQKSERRESKKVCSYAEIAHKLGILSVNTTHAEISKQESRDTVESRTDSDETCATTIATTCDCSSTLDNNPTEQLSTNSSCSTDSSCTTLVNDSVDGIPNDSHQTSSICDTVKLPCASSNCSQLSENSSRKSSSDEDLTSQLSSPNECRTSNVSSGSNGAKYTNVLIDVERLHMDRLSSLPSDSWNINNDLVLVHFLCDIHEKSNQGRCKVSNHFLLYCKLPLKLKAMRYLNQMSE